MQIKNIILYKDSAHIRELKFHLGRVNIITGQSMSGKTAIIDIVNYCLGSNSCKIADGVLRKNVHWFAITLSIGENNELFIARMNPLLKGVSSVSQVYIQEGNFATYPAFEDIIVNSNIENLKIYLSQKIGISDNLQITESGTRAPLIVNFKHTRPYCFQPQTLIDQRDLLFYGQEDGFEATAIKDSMPYFLGAIQEDYLMIKQQIDSKKRQLNQLVRQKNEADQIKGDNIGKAFSLVEEAKQIGIIDKYTSIDNISDALKILDNIKDWEVPKDKIAPAGESAVLQHLQYKLNSNKEELENVEDSIKATETFIKNNFLYGEEIRQQKVRLEAIHLFTDNTANNDHCPLCGSVLETDIPSITAINQTLIELNNTLANNLADSPRLSDYLNQLRETQDKIKSEIAKDEESILALYKEHQSLQTARDLNLRRGRVIGRISLYLESVNFTLDTSIAKKIENLRSEIENLSSQIDLDAKMEKLNAIINKLNYQMTQWVRDGVLDTEDDDVTIRFDLKKLQLYADKDDRCASLSQIGSGANWVSYHIMIMFALQKFLIRNNRPVPKFLIIDQPSQAYFPSQNNMDNQTPTDHDIASVQKIFDFMFNETESLDGQLQVIITEHANLENERYQEAILEVWRDGLKLIPESWYQTDREDIIN